MKLSQITVNITSLVQRQILLMTIHDKVPLLATRDRCVTRFIIEEHNRLSNEMSLISVIMKCYSDLF